MISEHRVVLGEVLASMIRMEELPKYLFCLSIAKLDQQMALDKESSVVEQPENDPKWL
jgi:hypothetical protein